MPLKHRGLMNKSDHIRSTWLKLSYTCWDSWMWEWPRLLLEVYFKEPPRESCGWVLQPQYRPLRTLVLNVRNKCNHVSSSSHGRFPWATNNVCGPIVGTFNSTSIFVRWIGVNWFFFIAINNCIQYEYSNIFLKWNLRILCRKSTPRYDCVSI